MTRKQIVSFKNTRDGYIMKITPDVAFESVITSFREALEEYDEVLENVEIIGVDGMVLDYEQKGKLMELFANHSNLKILSLENVDIQKIYNKQLKANKKISTFDNTDLMEIINEHAMIDFGDVGVSSPLSESIERIVGESLKGTEFDDNQKSHQESVSAQALTDDKKHKNEKNCVFHKGTLRSGRSLEADGDLVVIGDVNKGAEIFARGNIVVMGSLKGIAHAGCYGDKSAFICAMRLVATQLRIASSVAISPENDSYSPEFPEIAIIENDRIVIKKYL